MKLWKRWGRLLVLWFIMGEQYFVLEAFYRLFRGERAHIAMLPVAGLCCVLIDILNQKPGFFNLHIRLQCAIGTLITLAVEFVFGCILNLWLGLAIWDYSHLWGNLLGQICIQFAGIWFILMPTCIWMEDVLRVGFGWNGKAYSLWSIYKELFTFRRRKVTS